jgi:signal peptidase I
MRFLRAGKTVKKGERVLAFDVMTGDQLFVDRMTYHFMAPKVGQGFVFRTGKIDSKYMKDRSTGQQIDQYYIKRLVGTPGDTLEIKDFTLFRNGEPITGSTAFDKNSRRSDKYVGYRNELSLSAGKTMTVPSDHYLALGDNSANSQDGRYWGYVPASEVIGRPILIYYPFSMHWGPAR